MTLLTGHTVVAIDADGVMVSDASGATRRLPTRTVVWAAGVAASRLATRLGELTGAALDGSGRVSVEPDLTLPATPRCSRSEAWCASGAAAETPPFPAWLPCGT